jgi:hypothetical protein
VNTKGKEDPMSGLGPLTYLFNGKPQATAHFAAVACSLPLNENV